MSFHERFLLARNAIISDTTKMARLSNILRNHHEDRASKERLDLVTGKEGTNRAAYPAGLITMDNNPFYLAVKLAIRESMRELEYMRDTDLLAHEIGAFEHLADEGEITPAFVVALTYSYAGDTRFGLLTEDLTRGGTCRLVKISDSSRFAVANHKFVQVDAIDNSVEYWVDLKNWRQGENSFLEAGKRYVVAEALVDFGAL